MKKIIINYGLLAGIIISIQMVIMVTLMMRNPDFKSSEIIGYGTMLIAFSTIFFAIRNYRDQQAGGVISFGKALKMGLLIALFGSTIYVVTWLIYYHFFASNFMEVYGAHVQKTLVESGASAETIAAKAKEMADFKEMYKNPVFRVAVTYMEIFPVGLVVSLFSSLILKRK